MDGAVTQMCYAGDLLVSERTGSEKTLWYRYDSSGNVIALTYESEIYMYLRNAQNDIIGLLDKDGKVVVRYTYDSWGQVVKIEGTLKKTRWEQETRSVIRDIIMMWRPACITAAAVTTILQSAGSSARMTHRF